jgi:hypothetical protein
MAHDLSVIEGGLARLASSQEIMLMFWVVERHLILQVRLCVF